MKHEERSISSCLHVFTFCVSSSGQHWRALGWLQVAVAAVNQVRQRGGGGVAVVALLGQGSVAPRIVTVTLNASSTPARDHFSAGCGRRIQRRPRRGAAGGRRSTIAGRTFAGWSGGVAARGHRRRGDEDRDRADAGGGGQGFGGRGQWRCMTAATPKSPKITTGKWLKIPCSPSRALAIRANPTPSASHQTVFVTSSASSGEDDGAAVVATVAC